MLGGVRPGAGRPRLDPEKTARPVSVWLDEARIDTAKAAGAGNVGAGIRLALDEWKQRGEKK